MNRYLYQFRKVIEAYYPPACYRISKLENTRLGYRYGVDYFDNPDSWFVTINYEKRWVKIIQQSKEVDIHSLIGNIGGYVGLFLGNNITLSNNNWFVDYNYMSCIF